MDSDNIEKICNYTARLIRKYCTLVDVGGQGLPTATYYMYINYYKHFILKSSFKQKYFDLPVVAYSTLYRYRQFVRKTQFLRDSGQSQLTLLRQDIIRPETFASHCTLGKFITVIDDVPIILKYSYACTHKRHDYTSSSSLLCT